MTDIKPIDIFCQEVFPQLYDETLTSYELLCKIINYVNIILEDNKKLIDELESTKKYVDTYFKQLDVNTEISKLITELANNPNSALYSFIATELNSFNVKDFGAVGDGVTDDSKAIYRAISTAKGRTIYFPEGVYICSDVQNNFGVSADLRGCGNVEIKRGVTPTKANGNYLMSFYNVAFANFENITFNCDRDKFLIETTPHFDINGNAITTDEKYLQWIDTACVYFYDNGKNITFKNCTFKNCSREGIMLQRGEYENVVIKYNKFINTSATFWVTSQVTGFKNLYYENNYVEECRTMPVEFDNLLPVVVENIKVKHNKFFNVCKCAVHLTAFKNVEICENEYTNRGMLYEHGRFSTDSITNIFTWCDVTKETPNAYMGENLTVHKNKVNSYTAVQFHGLFTDVPDSGYHYKNISIYHNYFNGNKFIIARFVENISIYSNRIYNTNVAMELTQCDNVEFKNNVGTALSLFAESTISRGGNTVVGSCKHITLINNHFELSGVVFSLISFNSESTTRLTLIDNRCNGWNLINQYNEYKKYVIELCRGNINTGDDCTLTVTPSGSTFTSATSAYIDTVYADLSNVVKDENGCVTIRTINTYKPVGRTLYIKFDANISVKTGVATSENKIVNEKTIPTGVGLLIAVATPYGWYVL